MSTTNRTATGWAGHLATLVALCLFATASPVLAQSADPPPDCGAPVKAIHISPLKFTDRALVLKALVSRIGKPHCGSNIHKDKERLDRLGYFSAAKLEEVPEGDGVVLKVTLVETAPYLPNVGISHTEENGFAAGPGLKAIDLAHTGITLSAGTRFGGMDAVLHELLEPVDPGGALDLRRAVRLPGPGRHTQRFHAEVPQRGRPSRQDHRRDSHAEGRLPVFLDEEQPGRHHPLRHEPGRHPLSRGGVDLRHPGPLVESPYGLAQHRGREEGLRRRSFWRVQFDLRRYIPLADRHTLALVSLTDYHTGEMGVDFPTYLQSYIGGTNSVRGWDLGSRSGQNEMLNTVEYRYTLMKRKLWKIWKVGGYIGLELAAFTDFGIAWTDSNQFAANNFITGYGGGLRLLVPWVSEIRLDFAAGQPGGGVSFQFGFGPKAVAQKAAARSAPAGLHRPDPSPRDLSDPGSQRSTACFARWFWRRPWSP